MTYDTIITKGGNDMGFVIGGTYKFEGDNGRELVIKFLKEEDRHWECDVISDNCNDYEGKRSIYKSSMLLNVYTNKRIYEEVEFDYYNEEFKGVRFTYQNPKVLDLYIEMALQTGDREWFNTVAKYKKELMA